MSFFNRTERFLFHLCIHYGFHLSETADRSERDQSEQRLAPAFTLFHTFSNTENSGIVPQYSGLNQESLHALQQSLCEQYSQNEQRDSSFVFIYQRPFDEQHSQF